MVMMMMIGYGRRSRSIKAAAAAAAAAVVCAAVVLHLAGPSIVGFVADDLPRLYGSVLEWLTPPYLYLVINAIILSIAASSRFTDKPPESGPPTTIYVASPSPEIDCAEEYDAGELTGVSAAAQAKEEEEEEEFVISRSNWSPKRRGKTTTTTTTTTTTETETETEIPTTTECYSNSREEKPPVSSRFGRRKSARPSPDGKVLGVVRPKRNETLESTWRTITEGRAVPLARHLKKADTWDARARASGAGDPAAPAPVPAPAAAMRKSETFQERRRRAPPSPSPSPSRGSGGGGRLRRGEASLGQDELNRRVEAFINKFNEEMRLQRQESFKQYMDMINNNRTSN